MATGTDRARERSYGEGNSLSPVDRFGVWLSARQIRRAVPDFTGKRVGDFGCGYQASFSRTILDEVKSLVLVDVSLAPDLAQHPRVLRRRGFVAGSPG